MIFSATITSLSKEGSTYYMYVEYANITSKHTLTLEEFIFLEVKDQVNIEYTIDPEPTINLIRPVKYPKRRSKGAL